MRPRFHTIMVIVATLSGCVAAPTSRVAGLERRQEDLATELAALRGKVETLNGKVAALGKRLAAAQDKAAQRNSDKRPPLDERRAVDPSPTPEGRNGDRAADPATIARGITPMPAPTVLPELDVDALRRESGRQLPRGYQRGLDLIRQGAYESAIESLRDFVRTKHTSPFVAGALYWIGQANLQLGQTYQAILAFTDVQQRFALDEYAPAAGYAAGLGFLQLGNVSEARRSFEHVLADYPDSPAATKARAKLAAGR